MYITCKYNIKYMCILTIWTLCVCVCVHVCLVMMNTWQSHCQILITSQVTRQWIWSRREWEGKRDKERERGKERKISSMSQTWYHALWISSFSIYSLQLGYCLIFNFLKWNNKRERECLTCLTSRMSDCASLPNRERLHSFQQVTYLKSPDTNTHRAGAGAGIGNYTVTRQQMKQSMLIGLRGGREERGERRGGELKEDI